MRDIALYRQILGLEEPWSVKEVELNIDEGRVDIHVEHPPGVKWKCPHCERDLSCNDHSPEWAWWHLDPCQLTTHCPAKCSSTGSLIARTSSNARDFTADILGEFAADCPVFVWKLGCRGLLQRLENVALFARTAR